MVESARVYLLGVCAYCLTQGDFIDRKKITILQGLGESQYS